MLRGVIKNKKGLTLIEILVTIGILSIIIAPLLSMFLNAYRNTINSQRIMSGAYISQAVMESCKNLDYVSLASQSSLITHYDSDEDGTGDCYIKVEKHPEGVPGSFSISEKASFVHIIYVGDTVHVLGDDGSYASFTTAASASYRIDSASGKILQLRNNADDSVLAQFSVKNAAYPLIILINIAQKTYGYENTITLSSGLTASYNETLIGYTTENNQDELICTDLPAANRYYGVNDYATALVHLKVSVYSDSTGTKKLGVLEETIKLPIQ